MNNEIYNQALDCLKNKMSILPVGKNKKPLTNWKEYQTRIATKQEVEQWFIDFPQAQLGLITGKINNITVVDIEKGGDFSKYPETKISKTGGGGRHYFYKYNPKYKNKARIAELTDIRGDGGFVVIPPSKTIKGKYEWIKKIELNDFPEHLFNQGERQSILPEYIGVPQGERNNALTSYIGSLLNKIHPADWEALAWPELLKANEKNIPPLSEKEVRNIFDSITKRAINNPVRKYYKEKDEVRESQANTIISLIESVDGVVFFYDEFNDSYISIPYDDYNEIWPCKSRIVNQWVSRLFWKKENKVPNSEALKSALNMIEAKAHFDGEQIKLHNRVATYKDSIWYDLSDSKWRAIEVNEKGWEISKNPPILFRRFKHQLPQIEPVKQGGDINKFLKFVNIKNEEQKLLVLVALVSSFVPSIPHVVLNVYGAQGSAKSTFFKLLRKLIDPSALEVLTISTRTEELAQILSHHWCNYFDNVSNISNWVSDMLCKAVTGDGFSKRELYSNDDDVIYSFKRCIGINGVNLIAIKPDLLDRSIMIELDRISENDRQQETDLYKEFEELSPIILGGIFDILSKAMGIYKTVKLNKLPRMADFTVWGSAIAQAMGYKQEDFIEAYYINIKNRNDEILSENFVALYVIELMSDKKEWKGTSSELLGELKTLAINSGVNIDKERSFPKASNSLSKKLNELKTNLAEAGIDISRLYEDKKRIICINKNTKNIVSIGSIVEDQQIKDFTDIFGDG